MSLPAPSPQPRGVSVVLPAYNEEAVIERTVRHVAQVLARLSDDFEIVVTNDGSADRTGAILAELASEPDLHLRVVTHAVNRGYGAALASGFDAARKELVFLTDGDKQFDVGELAGFLPAMDDQTDLVIGWRRQRADAAVQRLGLEAAGQRAVRLRGAGRRLCLQALPPPGLAEPDRPSARSHVQRRAADQGASGWLPGQGAAGDPLPSSGRPRDRSSA